MILLIHSITGAVASIGRGEAVLFKALVLDGYRPVGPRGQVLAAKILAGR